MSPEAAYRKVRATLVVELQRKLSIVKNVRPERRAGLLREVAEIEAAIQATDHLYALVPVEVRARGERGRMDAVGGKATGKLRPGRDVAVSAPSFSVAEGNVSEEDRAAMSDVYSDDEEAKRLPYIAVTSHKGNRGGWPYATLDEAIYGAAAGCWYADADAIGVYDASGNLVATAEQIYERMHEIAEGETVTSTPPAPSPESPHPTP